MVDNTSYWRMHEEVPLVVAGVNPEAAEGHSGILANPNCTTMVMMMALAPIHRAVGLERVVVSTYQAVSGTGQRAIEELARPVAGGARRRGGPAAPTSTPTGSPSTSCPRWRCFKDGDDYTTEERKVMAETRKILDLDEQVGISATCARVPVFTGHSESINVQTREELSPEDCRELLVGATGVHVVDDPAAGRYPMAIDAAGRTRSWSAASAATPSRERTLNLWVVGDNLRKGAATNAVQIAELLVERGLLVQPALSARRRAQRRLKVALPRTTRAILSLALGG